MITTCRVQASVGYLVSGRAQLLGVAAFCHAEFNGRFEATSAELGFQPAVARSQWGMAVTLAAMAGVSPERLTTRTFERGRTELLQAYEHFRPQNLGLKLTKSGLLFGAQTVLFQLGMVNSAPFRRNKDHSSKRALEWAKAAPQLAETLQGYIEQIRVSLRPSTMVGTEGTFRQFALWMATKFPEVRCVADLRRRHIEAYKLHLATRLSSRGTPLSKITIATHLGTLRACFERLAEWGGDDVPSAVLMFYGDRPLLDEPLPRFLDDGASTKLLQAARADRDPFVRLCVEFLARTGLRKGEFLNLKVDTVVQIGSAYWLHVPVGKLRNDRYIPLHPQLKKLLDEWLAGHPAKLRIPYLFVNHGQRIGPSKVNKAVAKAAKAAGISPVTPHQLRHTLATQAINRGMSMEAIAALLGHRSMRMTMVYARIANRTVAEEYFKVSEKVEALYDAPRTLPGEAEGAEMRKLRAEMSRRMLGNGYCARPVGLDCHFESICESCTFFQTTIEFKPTIQRQRDDAAAKGQIARQKVFEGILERLDEAAS